MDDFANTLVSFVPFLSVIAALVTGFLAWFVQRKQASTDAASQLTGAALELVESQQRRIDRLEKRIEEVEDDYMQQITALLGVLKEWQLVAEDRGAQLLEHGITPRTSTPPVLRLRGNDIWNEENWKAGKPPKDDG